MLHGQTRRIYWESDCGHSGSILTASGALAHLIRESLTNHDKQFKKCHLADIEKLETGEERAKRLNKQPELGAGFC